VASEAWDEARVQQYITDRVEESLTLDYKAAAKLAKSDTRTSDITKIVSSMANAAGGIVIFGIEENQTNKQWPERIDPVNRKVCSKETLDQLINNIRPKVNGVVIHPVPIGGSNDQVVYVVEIPQSYTAHQATDHKYYKRHNFESVPMEDYEIRDVMGRGQYPRIGVELQVTSERARKSTGLIGERPSKVNTEYEITLHVTAFNTGLVYAEYVHIRVEVPSLLVYNELSHMRGIAVYTGKESLDEYEEYVFRNTHRDILRWEALGGHQYGPTRYVPLLAGDEMEVGDLTLENEVQNIDWGERTIRWEAQADNAPSFSGEVLVNELLSNTEAL
jgi:hypothetical protein